MESFNKINPKIQVGISLVLGLICMFGATALREDFGIQQQKPWVFAVTFLLFYIVFNVIFSLGAENAEKYWTQSMIGFAVLILSLGGAAYLSSGLGINEAGSFKWIFTVVIIAYLVFMSIVRAIKGIVEFAQREEWQQPKKKYGEDTGERKKRRF